MMAYGIIGIIKTLLACRYTIKSGHRAV